MTLDQFIAKYTGTTIDTDGAYGGQCMDLMHKYCQDVLGLADLRILAAPTAKDVWLTTPFGKEKFEAIANTPTGVPEKGDIVFWGTGIGPAGHVAVFVQGDVNSFRSFDQNFPTGSKCAVTNHPNYAAVLGWLRFKAPAPQPDLQAQLDAMRKQRDDNWNLYQTEQQKTKDLTAQLATEQGKTFHLSTALKQIKDIATNA